MNKKELETKITEIVDRYDVTLLAVVTNIQGTHDVLLDHNIYYVEHEKMETEIRKLGNINDIDYKDVA